MGEAEDALKMEKLSKEGVFHFISRGSKWEAQQSILRSIQAPTMSVAVLRIPCLNMYIVLQIDMDLVEGFSLGENDEATQFKGICNVA